MSAFNLPPGVTLQDIDRLFEDSDESQCLDTEVEDQLTDFEPLSTEQIAAIQALLAEPSIF
jgi:hypothetical protein